MIGTAKGRKQLIGLIAAISISDSLATWVGGCVITAIIGWMLASGMCYLQPCKDIAWIRTPIVKLLFAIMAVLCVLQWDVTPICLRNLILCGALYVLSLVDLDCYRIPDSCLVVALLAWVGAIPFAPEYYGGVFGILCSIGSALLYGGGLLLFSLLMDQILQKESMGGGDIKLFFVMGLYLGVVGTFFAMFFACLLGLCFAAVFRARKAVQIPFGPSIAIAFWFMLLYGQPLIDWYTGLIRL